MAYSAENRTHLLRAINEFLDDSIVLPPGQLENPDLLKNISKYQDVLAQRKKRQELEEKKIQDKEGGNYYLSKCFCTMLSNKCVCMLSSSSVCVHITDTSK